ncbi:HAD hydrolase-like protein [Imperialibacter roseus]|uniref:HAD hydrolase-like protein n=1 Tax=Imperialibacter roseus TaxID=1324217 RepID=A0ABZ0ILV2_9BACT|nr:HAD hydrolase-like protein [Imperialibacter roseus]WOK05516.1 HAD hydrolase-like protein [Imperialibacter roseus]
MLKMGSIQLVVFDLAGTTVQDDQDVQKVLRKTLQRQGVSITMDEAAKVMGIPKPVALRQLLEYHLPESIKVTDDMIDELHDAFVSDMVSFYEEDPSVREMAGASDTFKVLKESGISVYVDTGFDRKTTDALIERLGWLKQELLDGSITSDEVESGRPHPDMIFKAMKLSKVTEASFVAKVGDTASDLGEGTAAGCGLVIGVTTGAYSREDLEKEPHTHIADSLPEVLQIILEK